MAAEVLEAVETIEGASVELAPSGPAANVAAATEAAHALRSVLEAKDMTYQAGSRVGVTAEAWNAMAVISGLTPQIEWTRPLADGTGWEARCVVRRANGRVVGAAESMCSRSEHTWRSRPEYAIRSMAQTRATSRALRPLLGFVAVLAAGAGSTTPAEELPAEPAETAEPELPDWAQPVTPTQLGRIDSALARILKAGGIEDPGFDVARLEQSARDRCGGEIPVCVGAALHELGLVVERAQTATPAADEPQSSA